MRLFFSKVAGYDLTKKGFHHNLFWLNFVNFSDQLFLKHVRANTSVPFRGLSDFTSKEVVVFLRVHFDSFTTTVIIWLTKQIQVNYMQPLKAVLLNSRPPKKSEHISENVRDGISLDKYIW